MLHYETIAPATRELLNKLMSDDRLQDFVLVGGTSLALQLGHRLSVDLDLIFSMISTKTNPSTWLMGNLCNGNASKNDCFR